MNTQKHPAYYGNYRCNSCNRCFNSNICSSFHEPQIKEKDNRLSTKLTVIF